MKKALILAGIVIFMVLAIIFILIGTKKSPSEVKIGYLPVTVDLPFFVAMEKGYFVDEGLKVEPVRFETTTQLYDAMLSGRIDATAIGGLTALYGIEANTKGQFKIYAFNANDEINYTDSLIVKVDSNITSPIQLKGKKIGTFPGTTIVVGTKLVMRKYGINDSDYEIVQISPNLQLQALQTGQVDALMTVEPTGTIARLKGIGKSILEAPNEKSIINPFPGGAAAFLSAWAEQHQDLALKIATANDKAIDYIKANPNESKKYLAKYSGLTEDIASETRLCLFWKVNDANKNAIQEYADILYREGIFKEKIDTSNIYFMPNK
jgi:NitT/TauT family transport system substrate-binding protein